MDKTSIFDVVRDFMNNLKFLDEAGDAYVLLENDEYVSVHSSVLKQLNFFRNILSDVFEKSLPKKDNLPIVFTSNNIFSFINKTSFNLLYDRLRTRLIGIAGSNENVLTNSTDQINYIRTIDYFTDITERKDLLSCIKCEDLTWIRLVDLKFENLNTFFDIIELRRGYEVCCRKIPNMSNSDALKGQLEQFLGLPVLGNSKYIKQIDPKSEIRTLETDEILRYLIKRGTDLKSPTLKYGATNLLNELSARRS